MPHDFFLNPFFALRGVHGFRFFTTILSDFRMDRVVGQGKKIVNGHRVAHLLCHRSLRIPGV